MSWCHNLSMLCPISAIESISKFLNKEKIIEIIKNLERIFSLVVSQNSISCCIVTICETIYSVLIKVVVQIYPHVGIVKNYC